MSNMLAPRGNHTATKLSNGVVVVVGGEASGRVLSSIEVYRGGAWAQAGTLNVARKGHTATVLANGRILIAGGQADTQGNMLLTTCEIYDPASGTVSPGPALSTPRVDHVAVAFSVGQRQLVLIAGGITAGRTSVDTAEVFDVNTGRIAPIPARMTTDRAGASAVALSGGRVLIQGGLSGFSASSMTPRPAGAELFDPLSLSFTATPNMGINRYGSGMAIPMFGNARVVVAGGNSGARLETTVESYDPGSGRWSNMRGNLSVAREGLTLTALRPNGTSVNLLAVGGSDGRPSGAIDLLANNTVTPLRPLRHARRGHSTTALGNGMVLVVGGFDVGNRAIATSEVYDAFAAPGTAPAPQPTTHPGAGQPGGFPGTTPGGFPGTTQPGQQAIPNVMAILPGTGKPGDLITVAGQNFAQNAADNLVFFQGGAQGRVLHNARIQNLPMLGTVQTLIVEVPAGARSGNVIVVSRGQTSAGRNFTVDMQSGGDPHVLYTMPRRSRPGGMVTIFGRNFARPAATNQVSFGGAPGNIVGGLTTQSVPFLGNLAVMVAVVPPNAVTGDLVITSNGKVSSGFAFEIEGTTAAPPAGPPAPGAPGTTPPPAAPAPGAPGVPAPGTSPVPPSAPAPAPGAPGTAPGPGAPAPAPTGLATLYAEDFEGATVSMSEQGGLWQAARPGPNGPTQAASGQWCAGTAMVSGRYDPGANGFLTTQEIDLTATTTAELRLNQWFETDGFDAGRVLVSPDAGTTWYLLRPDGGYATAGIFNPGEGFVGQSGAWLATTFDLSAYAGDRIMISFEFAADGVDERAGWFIDDIEVIGQ